jgi:hypothetical protein
MHITYCYMHYIEKRHCKLILISVTMTTKTSLNDSCKYIIDLQLVSILFYPKEGESLATT